MNSKSLVRTGPHERSQVLCAQHYAASTVRKAGAAFPKSILLLAATAAPPPIALFSSSKGPRPRFKDGKIRKCSPKMLFGAATGPHKRSHVVSFSHYAASTDVRLGLQYLCSILSLVAVSLLPPMAKALCPARIKTGPIWNGRIPNLRCAQVPTSGPMSCPFHTMQPALTLGWGCNTSAVSFR